MPPLTSPLLRSLPRTTLPRLLRHTHTTSEKQHAAAHAIADHLALLTPGAFIGIGSGSTIPHLVTALKTTSSIFVPTSHQSRQLLLDARLPICAIDALPPHTRLRIAFDGADEVDSSRNCIKGGGACLMLEKLVAVQAERFIVIADASKRSRSLGTVYKRGIPIEVVPAAAPYVLAGLEVLGAVEPALRMGGEVKAGPCVTENGNFLIDAPFPDGVMGGGMVEGGLAGQVVALAAALKQMVGVVEHGLFTAADRAPDRVYFGVWGEGECKVEVLDDA